MMDEVQLKLPHMGLTYEPALCQSPTWCGVPYSGPGSLGPGLYARLGIDYVRGWHFEQYCSIICRDLKVPKLTGYPANYNGFYHGP